MSKYKPLYNYLNSNGHLQKVRLTFTQIERILGEALPASAYDHEAWWANQQNTERRSWAAAWLDSGFRVDSFNQ